MDTTAPILSQDKKRELQKLISRGHPLDDVFEKIRSIFDNLSEKQQRSLILLESQYQEFKRVRNLNIKSPEYLDRQNNNLYYRVTEYIDELATADVSIVETAHPAQNLLNYYPTPRPLFGYEEEMEILRERFERETIVGIHGMGGVGKTSFVTSFIDQHIVDKSKVIWQENCSDFEFDTFITNIGYGDILRKFSGEDRYFQLLRQLENDSMSVFWDNLEIESSEHNEFVQFLQTCGRYLNRATFVLIGHSRFEIEPLKIYNIELPGLRHDKAIAFAKSLDSFAALKLPDDKLMEIVENVRGNPQGIKSALDSLRYGARWDELFSELQDDNPFDRLLQSVFQNEEEKGFLLAFSVFKNQVSRSAVQHTTGMDNDTFNATVRRLIDKSVINVIQTFEGDPYFTTSNLIREKSYRKLDDPIPLHRQAAEFFLNQRTDKLDIDLENRIFYHCKKSGWCQKVEETLRRHGKRFLTIGHFTLISDMVEFLETHEAVSPTCYLLLGKIHYVKGEFDRALHYYEEAHRRAVREDAEAYVCIEAQIRTGWVKYRLGDISSALMEIHDAFIASRDNQIDPLEIEALNKLGWIYNIYDKPDITKGFYREAEKIAEKLNIPSLMGHIYESKGSLYMDLEEYELAAEVFRKGLEHFHASEHQEGIAYINRNLGHYHLKTGNLDQAREYYSKSLKYYLQIYYRLGISRVRTDLGWLEAKNGDIECGISQIRNAINLSKGIKDLSGAIFGYYSIGRIYFQLSPPKTTLALQYLLHAKALQLSTLQKSHRILRKIQEAIDQLVGERDFKEVMDLGKEAYAKLPAELRERFGLEALIG